MTNMFSIAKRIRMDGLAPQTQLTKLTEAVDAIKNDLRKEGFNDKEIADYLLRKMQSSLILLD